ncbi:DUF397 domain-containing protein [Streptomyces xiamenensis]|uniref:DUF397 domain-containing protein n=1 Tax=Streptomyces xiamenensis TaxID=408015 RepID=UPI003D736278
MIPGPTWQRSSYSSGDPSSDCIEVAHGPSGSRYLRESDDPGTVLVTTPARWAACCVRPEVAPHTRPSQRVPGQLRQP